MARINEERWRYDEATGSWSRRIGGVEETTSVNPNATEGALEAAEEAGVDLATVQGSGKGGRITKADVESAAS